jgi:hypothetical protein
MAVDAMVLFYHFRKVIALEIKGVGHPEHVARAILHTQFTTLAAFLQDGYLSLRDRDGSQVKGNTPVLHLDIPFVMDQSFLTGMAQSLNKSNRKSGIPQISDSRGRLRLFSSNPRFLVLR